MEGLPGKTSIRRIVTDKGPMWVGVCRFRAPGGYMAAVVAQVDERLIRREVLKELENRPGWGFGSIVKGIKKIGKKVAKIKVVKKLTKGVKKLVGKIPGGKLAFKMAMMPTKFALKNPGFAMKMAASIIPGAGPAITALGSKGKLVGLGMKMAGALFSGSKKDKRKVKKMVRRLAKKAIRGDKDAEKRLQALRVGNALVKGLGKPELWGKKRKGKPSVAMPTGVPGMPKTIFVEHRGEVKMAGFAWPERWPVVRTLRDEGEFEGARDYYRRGLTA